jgi:hypothetical protein
MFERFTGGLDGTLWYYTTLATVFSRRFPGSLAADLRETLQDMRRLIINSGAGPAK